MGLLVVFVAVAPGPKIFHADYALVGGTPEGQLQVFFFFDEGAVNQNVNRAQNLFGMLGVAASVVGKQVGFQNVAGPAPNVFFGELLANLFYKVQNVGLVFNLKRLAAKD